MNQNITQTQSEPMTEPEARQITDRINDASSKLWSLLSEAHERKAWAALGYANWRDYAVAEFNVSQSRAYQLLDHAKVIGAIKEAANSTNVEISEFAAREIKPKLSKVVEKIKAKVQGGEDPAKATYEVIEATRVESKKAASKVVPRPIPAEPADEDDDHDRELADLADELQRENLSLQAQIAAAEADDLVAEAVKWRKAYDHAVRSQSEAMDSAHASQKREKFSMTQLRRCGKAVGVDDPRHIAKAVEELAHQVKRAAA